MSLLGVKIIFVANNHKCCATLNKYFNNVHDVKVIRCTISQLKPVDCIVCPGDSYAIMENSINRTINTMLNIKSDIQRYINDTYYGEQPVGTTTILNIKNDDYKYIAYVPIMKYNVNMNMTHNIYTAFRSLLVAIMEHNKHNNNNIRTVLCPIFGIDDDMDLEEAVHQMSTAYGILSMNLKCNKNNKELINKYLNI